MTTRADLAYRLIKELNPCERECPEIYRFSKELECIIMLRVYQVRRWPKARIETLIGRVEYMRASRGF